VHRRTDDVIVLTSSIGGVKIQLSINKHDTVSTEL
jgi:hypothetical protein